MHCSKRTSPDFTVPQKALSPIPRLPGLVVQSEFMFNVAPAPRLLSVPVTHKIATS